MPPSAYSFSQGRQASRSPFGAMPSFGMAQPKSADSQQGSLATPPSYTQSGGAYSSWQPSNSSTTQGSGGQPYGSYGGGQKAGNAYWPGFQSGGRQASAGSWPGFPSGGQQNGASAYGSPYQDAAGSQEQWMPQRKAPESWKSGEIGAAVVDRYVNPETGETAWTPGSNYRPPADSGWVRERDYKPSQNGQPQGMPVPREVTGYNDNGTPIFSDNNASGNPLTDAEKNVWDTGNDYMQPDVSPQNNGLQWDSSASQQPAAGNAAYQTGVYPTQQANGLDISSIVGPQGFGSNIPQGVPTQNTYSQSGAIGYQPGSVYSFAPPPMYTPFQSASVGFDGVVSSTPNYTQRDAFVNNINSSLGDFWMANRTNPNAPPPQFDFADLWSRAGDMAANGWQNPLLGLFG